jgi:biopolymer transport protein ExbD
MTPMVDLAFLLLTFFILTTTLYKPHVMKVAMPDKAATDPPKQSAKDVINFVLAENNKVYWWMGLEPSGELTNYSKDGIRKILVEKGSTNPNPMVLIKPKDNSHFENMVDMLDEMAITSMELYAIVDFTDDDQEVMVNSCAVSCEEYHQLRITPGNCYSVLSAFTGFINADRAALNPTVSITITEMINTSDTKIHAVKSM